MVGMRAMVRRNEIMFRLACAAYLPARVRPGPGWSLRNASAAAWWSRAGTATR